VNDPLPDEIMSTDKPSKSEDDYFTQRDMDIMKLKRQQKVTESQQTERLLHIMKCPKCGSDLDQEEFHGVTIERCPEDGGIWLDAGEVEQLIDEKTPGLLARVFSSVSSSLSEDKPE
jgi:hypothetical protein